MRQKSYGFTIAQKFKFGDENVVASNWLKIEYVLVRGMGIYKNKIFFCAYQNSYGFRVIFGKLDIL